jgi:hypothetical protein
MCFSREAAGYEAAETRRVCKIARERAKAEKAHYLRQLESFTPGSKLIKARPVGIRAGNASGGTGTAARKRTAI